MIQKTVHEVLRSEGRLKYKASNFRWQVLLIRIFENVAAFLLQWQHSQIFLFLYSTVHCTVYSTCYPYILAFKNVPKVPDTNKHTGQTGLNSSLKGLNSRSCRWPCVGLKPTLRSGMWISSSTGYVKVPGTNLCAHPDNLTIIMHNPVTGSN